MKWVDSGLRKEKSVTWLTEGKSVVERIALASVRVGL